jgi:hypothetical protein
LLDSLQTAVVKLFTQVSNGATSEACTVIASDAAEAAGLGIALGCALAVSAEG